MKRLLLTVVPMIAVLLLLLAAAAPVSAQTDASIGDLEVSIAPAETNLVLGETIDLEITVTNTGTATATDVVVHIDITDPSDSTSVDPEDWTPTLSRTVASIPAGEQAVLNWSMQPISPGDFAVYSVLLQQGVDQLAGSNVAVVTVDDQRTLNPNGILPVAIGAPILVGGLLLGQIGYRRRPRFADA